MDNKFNFQVSNWFNQSKRRAKQVMFILLCLIFFANTLILPQNIFAADSDFLIAKSVDQDVVNPGENFTYTIQYSNPDILNNAINTVITDALPANVVYVTAEGSSHIASIEKTGSPGSETVIFHFIETLPAGSTGILHITCKFPEGTTIGGAANQAVNSATIVSDNKPLITSNEVIVTPLTLAPNWSISKTKIIPSTVPALDNAVTYQISVNGNSTIGGLNMTNVVITDTLPSDAVYVSSSGGGVYDSGTGIITFPAIATLAVGQTATRTVTLLYPSPTFTVASSVTNQAAATGTPLGETDPISIQTDITHGFTEPVFAIGDFSKTARQSNDRYSIGQEAVFYMNGIANTGNVPLDQFVVEDAIPSIIDLNSITTGSYNQAVHVAVYFKTDIQTNYVLWTELDNPSNNQLNVSGISPALAVGEVITHVKWVLTAAGGILPGFSIVNSITVRATVLTPSGTDITNTAVLTATRGVETLTDTSSKQIFVIDAMPWLAPAKTVRQNGIGNFGDNVTVNMRDTLEFRLRIQNYYFATGNLVDPIAVDVLPAELENFIFVSTETTAGIVLDEPVASIVDGKWVFSFTGTLLPGQYIDVFYTAKVKDQTSVGLFTNKLYMSTKDNATQYQNDPGSLIVDATDLDGDGSTTDNFIQDNATFFVKFSGSLNSQKLMRGSLDTEWTQYPNYGSTLPGGISDYQINLTNDGSNGPISNIIIVDELPDIGDFSVLGSTARLSSWRPYLVNTITFRYYNAIGVEVSFPAEAQIVCYYSTSASVSHAELYDPINGSSDVSWSVTPPDDITTVRALKFEIKNLELAKSEKITVEFPMRAPIDSPVGTTAWNSFAYGATYESYANDVIVDAAFLPSEPLKVGYVVADPALYSYTIGDRVWEDMNKNGLQEAGEPGINGVLVNLYDSTDQLVSYTRSGDNQAGEAGYYLFPNILAGDYYLEFVYPTTYQVTDYHTGADATIDSDIDETRVLPTTDLGVAKNAIKTDTFTLSGNNLTLDAGLYQYAELGNKVWNDRDADGVQDAGEPGVAGVQVDLLNASDAVLATTTTDVNGLYLFASLDPGTYKVKFSNPSDHYAFSPTNVGADDTVDSDGTAAGDGLSATTGTITLVSAQSDLTVDQGIFLGQIGDFVFHDINANGLREGGDVGIGGVTVNLYAADGTTLLQTTTTDSNGFYLFDELIPANYIVEVIVPGTYNRITLQNAGADDTVDSDFDRTTGKTAAITIDIGERDMTIDAGLYKYASIGNYVWNDRDADGVQDAGEPVIVGATVELLKASDDTQAVDDNGTPVAPTVTNASGIYSFGTLTPGSYKVKFTNPGGNYGISPANVGGDTLDSDGIAAGDNLSTTTGSYTLTSGQNDTSVDQGFYLGRIGDLVFHDLNANGIKEAGDVGITGITVKLYAADGTTLLQTTTTNASGLYYFEDLFAASYIVEVSNLGLYNRFTLQDQGADDAVDSDVDRTSGRTGLIAIAIGERNLTIDAGLYKYASIGNYVWNDRDADGVQDAGEPVIVGATVELLKAADDTQAVDDNGTPVAPTVTNASGIYSFGTLTPGSYKVKFTNPSGNYGISPANVGGDTTDSDGIAAGDNLSTTTGSYTLTSAQYNDSVDQGFYLGRIGDLVFHDLNANGIKEAGDVGITGITVKLYAADGTTLLQTTTTNTSGLYYFEDLFAGSYIVEVSNLGLYNRFTLQDQGADDAVDSDVDRTSGRTGLIAIAIGERNLTVDAGLYKYASIGNYVWNDRDADGVQDAGEPVIVGATVELLKAADDTQAVDDNGTPVAPTVTNASGIYSFGTLTPGSYKVKFTNPDGNYGISPANLGGNDSTDSDGIAAGDNLSTTTGSYTLISAQSNTSVDQGFYLGRIGDLVFHDLNANGIYEGGETGITSITVKLYAADGTTLLQTTTTNASGLYYFEDIFPGSYVVEVSNLGLYNRVTFQNMGADDAVDSDFSHTTGKTDLVVMTSGERDLTVDAGLYKYASIGDKTWFDLDADGVQDGGEAALPGVTVHLLNNDGSPASDDNGTLVDAAVTNASGIYGFNTLTPGVYKLQFDLPTIEYRYSPLNTTTALIDSDVIIATGLTAPTTLTSDESDISWDAGFYKAVIGDFVFEDKDADGIQDGGEPGLANITVELWLSDGLGGWNYNQQTTTDANGLYTFTQLDSGIYQVRFASPGAAWYITPANRGADDAIDSDQDANGYSGDIDMTIGESDKTIDAGFYRLASVGDRVWNDLDADGVQDGGEVGIPGITVNLTGPDALSLQTITDASGNYNFTGLVPGSYTLTVDEDSLPFAGYETYELDGSLNHSTTVTLISNDARTDVDFGYAYLTSIGDTVWNDLNADGIQDVGESGLPGVTVQLLNASDGVLDTTVTDIGGSYLFNQLTVGSYKIKVVIPTQWLVSPQNAGADDAADNDAASGGSTGLYSLLSGAANLTADIGLYHPASIGNTVWLDQNGNGIQDEIGEGFANVTVQLYNGVGTLLDSTTTDVDGQYLFDSLTPGDYQIRFILPNGYGFTVQNAAAANEATDSDATFTTGYDSLTTLISDEDDLTHDAGLVKPEIQLSKQIYAGTYDAEQTPLDSLSIMQGLPVTYLFVVTNTGDSYLTDVVITDVTLGISDADMVLALGSEPLAPGDSMTFYYETTMNGDLLNTATVSANPCAPDGSDLPGLTNPQDTDDAARYALSSIGDTVWNDIDGDGVQDAGEPVWPGVRVVLTNGDGPVAETTTDADGLYLFDDLVPDTYTVSIDISSLPAKYHLSYEQDGTLNNSVDVILGDGDIRTDIDFGYYILSSIGDLVWHDQNANGIQDDGEPGLAGVTVDLLDDEANILATTTTDENGNYIFANLTVGSYRIAITLPTDWYVCPALAGSDEALDSDIEADNQTRQLLIVGGQDLTDIDAGLYQLASLGDTVWLDINRDGIQQDEEVGIADVQINLLNVTDDTLTTTSTDADGLYTFAGLVPGSYRIEVIKPAKLAFAAMNRGSDVSLDSDVDAAGRTSLMMLASGEVNSTVDAGLYNVIIFPGIVIDDDGIPVGGAVVIIVDEDGNEIGEVISDPDGHFVFDVPINIVITIIIKKPGYEENRTVVIIEDEDFALANYVIEDEVVPATGESSGESWPAGIMLMVLAAVAVVFRKRLNASSDWQ